MYSKTSIFLLTTHRELQLSMIFPTHEYSCELSPKMHNRKLNFSLQHHSPKSVRGNLAVGLGLEIPCNMKKFISKYPTHCNSTLALQKWNSVGKQMLYYRSDPKEIKFKIFVSCRTSSSAQGFLLVLHSTINFGIAQGTI